jgi:ribonuclease P protein component
LNEANVSAKCVGAKAEARLSRSYGLRGRSSGIIQEAGERTKTPVGLVWAGSMQRLTKRRDFVRVSKIGQRAGGRFFSLQIAWAGRKSGLTAVGRVGLTATKKVGNAVERNRARRRMRALIGSVFSEYVMRDIDCVLLARRPMLDAKFDQLAAELRELLKKLRIDSRNTDTAL